MIAEIGHILLIITFVSSIIQIIFWFSSIGGKNRITLYILQKFSFANFIFILTSFSTLLYSFIISDFSLSIVTNNSHSLKPLMYKISGVWGNHEGSLMLWILILSFFTYMISRNKVNMHFDLLSSIIGVQTIILFSFLAFILFTSNPFDRMDILPIDGKGLNPLLQDPGLAFHPPILYLGYVGLSVAFSFAVGALITGEINKEWGQQLRPWITIAWSSLTLGIALGSWWAYYELGWGGWWFWDPVENASFMPWLIATALLHSVRLLETRFILVSWTVLLAILGFSFSLLGTFIVRSGLLTSVHAFASDPSRGIFILIILAIATGVPLILYAIRSSSIFKEKKIEFDILSKESALLINNLFLCTATATVLIGTLYPLFLDAFNGEKISIGPAYYNATFAPIMAPVILIMAIAPSLSWGKYKTKQLLKKLIFIIIITILGGLLLSMIKGSTLFSIICGSLSIWLFSGVLIDFASQIRLNKIKINNIKSMFIFLSKNSFGMHVAHIGVAIFLAGVTGEQFYKTEFNGRKNIGDIINIGDKSLKFENISLENGPNYQSEIATFTLLKDNKTIEILKPEKRFYPVQQNQTTEAAILSGFLGDTYLVLGDGNKEIGWSIRLYYNPLVSWIWGGACFMALGGLISILQNRKRQTKVMLGNKV